MTETLPWDQGWAYRAFIIYHQPSSAKSRGVQHMGTSSLWPCFVYGVKLSISLFIMPLCQEEALGVSRNVWVRVRVVRERVCHVPEQMFSAPWTGLDTQLQFIVYR